MKFNNSDINTTTLKQQILCDMCCKRVPTEQYDQSAQLCMRCAVRYEKELLNDESSRLMNH